MDGLGCHTVGENTVGKSKEHTKPASHRAVLILHSISAVRDGWHLPVLGPVRGESLRSMRHLSSQDTDRETTSSVASERILFAGY